MYKLVAASLAAAAILAVGPGALAGDSPAPKLVHLIFIGYAYPYFAPMAEAVKQAASHNPDLSIRIVDANNSASQEITDIKEATAAGAKGSILNTIQESVTGAARQAMQQGMPIVTVDRDVAAPAARVAFVGDNDETLGHQETGSWSVKVRAGKLL